PLWRLLDFASHCPAAERDGIEAGLLASGLLDAWVSPDGAVTLPDGAADALIDPDGSGLWSSGPSLLEVLVILPEIAVSAEVLVEVLGKVGLVDSAVTPPAASASPGPAVARDGSFRLGPLTGLGPAQPARFIGVAAQ